MLKTEYSSLLNLITIPGRSCVAESIFGKEPVYQPVTAADWDSGSVFRLGPRFRYPCGAGPWPGFGPAAGLPASVARQRITSVSTSFGCDLWRAASSEARRHRRSAGPTSPRKARRMRALRQSATVSGVPEHSLAFAGNFPDLPAWSAQWRNWAS